MVAAPEALCKPAACLELLRGVSGDREQLPHAAVLQRGKPSLDNEDEEWMGLQGTVWTEQGWSPFPQIVLPTSTGLHKVVFL